METLDSLYSELFEAVMLDDLASQRHYMQVVETQRKIPMDYLFSLGALFIPNDEYIHHYLGDKVYSSNAGLYYNELCPWLMHVIFPIRNLIGETVGIVGWDAHAAYEKQVHGVEGKAMYRVSAKSVFARDKYFLSDINCLKHNFDSRVVFVTDGVFDCITLNYRNIPTIALMGSSFSREIIYFLSWYKHVYLCADNDNAGLMLYNKMKKALPNVHRVIQNKTKDIEELLRTDGKDGPITAQFLDLMKNPIKDDISLKL